MDFNLRHLRRLFTFQSVRVEKKTWQGSVRNCIYITNFTSHLSAKFLNPIFYTDILLHMNSNPRVSSLGIFWGSILACFVTVIKYSHQEAT